MKKKLILIILGIILVFIFLNVSKNDKKNETVTTTSSPTSSPDSININAIPDDASIIFWSTRNVKSPFPLGPSHLYTMNIDGSRVTQITTDAYNYEHAVVSPDRKYIAAARDTDGRRTVWMIDLQNKLEYKLLPNFHETGNGGVDWSKDNWIYFRGKETSSSSSGVYRVKPDGKDLTKLTNNQEVFDVSVSEDGTMIAHVTIVRTPCVKAQIWVLNSDGSNHRLADDGGPGCGTQGPFPLGDYDPEISPDNKYVLFSRTNEDVPRNFAQFLNAAHDIWIKEIDSSEPARRVTEPGPVSIIPDWKGNLMLYTEYNERENYVGLVTINTDGTNKKRLENNPARLFDGGRHGKFIL